MQFKTKKGRITVGVVLALVAISGLYFSITNMRNLDANFSIMMFCFAVAAGSALWSPIVIRVMTSKEEDETGEKQARENKLFENARIVAEALATCSLLKSVSNRPPEFRTEDVLYEHIMPVLNCRAEHGMCNQSACCEKKVFLRKNIEITLAVLAKWFEVVGEAQKKNQVTIDRLAKGNESLSHEAVEEFFSTQTRLDQAVEEAKGQFWKIHGAAKELGGMVYPKYSWYLLLWHPGIVR